MRNMKYFYELFDRLPRGGPGDNQSTKKAYSFMNDIEKNPLILDIGCGPGMQTIELAKLSHGTIIALDRRQQFLDNLMKSARQNNVEHYIKPMLKSMQEMDFEKETFDIIWSEGALYFMGFSNGLKKCYQLLKPNGYLAVTESVYLKENSPQPVLEFWEEYPDITHIQQNINLIKNTGFDLISHFTLPTSSWIEEFYNPMQKQINILKEKHKENKEALELFDTMQKEIDIYKKYNDYFGYEFFIMKKPK